MVLHVFWTLNVLKQFLSLQTSRLFLGGVRPTFPRSTRKKKMAASSFGLNPSVQALCPLCFMLRAATDTEQVESSRRRRELSAGIKHGGETGKQMQTKLSLLANIRKHMRLRQEHRGSPPSLALSFGLLLIPDILSHNRPGLRRPVHVCLSHRRSEHHRGEHPARLQVGRRKDTQHQTMVPCFYTFVEAVR